ncbi:AI-2E family transporter [Microvirga lenta]|uniref:AI-2E family transporter n=1 Tax=Microvirga lenta TaxID=2881337 RepID=UPI001CFFB01B|nr:AI-2E family transporter [Microvirga lenta]MCB5176310.1 AI-2E family transporter [Microvirga lenta]
MNEQGGSSRGLISDAEFIRKCLIVLGIVLLTLVLWSLSSVLLLGFGAILVAIIFHSAAEGLVRYLRVPERWSLALASLLILGLFVGLAILFGTQLRSQLTNVIEQLPRALDNFGRAIGVGAVSDDLSNIIDSQSAGGLASRLAGIGGTILGGLADFLLVIVAGLYIAASPKTYVDGLVKLFPVKHHERVRGSLHASGEALKLWLLSQLIAMVCVGVLSTLAYWMIGLPYFYALGLIAGLVDFIPFLGPILGALPAVMIAFTLEGNAALWTIVAVLAIQQIEGNIIFPLVARKVVTIPAALALFAIVAGGILFGSFGLIFGFPLAVVTYVLVKKLYVRETLGEDTPIPGEDETADKPS